jgi:hypothetical protein
MRREAATLLAAIALTGCSQASLPVAGVTSTSPSVISRSGRLELRIEGHGFVPRKATTNEVIVELKQVRGVDGAPGSGQILVVGGTASAPSVGAEQATLSIDTATMAPGVYDLTLSVAQHQSYAFPEAILVLPTPTWGDLQRLLICATDPSGTDLLLSGVDIPVVDGRSEALLITGVHGVLTETEGVDCRPVRFSRASVSLCSGLRSPLPPTSEGPAFAVELASHPGDPLAGWPRRFWIQSGPVLQAPARSYSVATGPAWVSIQGPLAFESAHPPRVTVDGLPVDLVSPCSPGQVVSCSSTDFLLPQSTPEGAHLVLVDYRNGCASSVVIEVAPRPVVTSWSPAFYCGGGRLRIYGTGFVAPVNAYSGGLWLQSSCESAGTNPCGDILITDPPLTRGDLSVTVESGTSPRSYSVPVNIPSGMPPSAGPLAPRMVAAGTAHRLVLPDIEQLTGAVTAVMVTPVIPSREVPAVSGLPFEYRLNGIVITIPATLPPGRYKFLVRDQGPCPMEAAGLLVVESKVLKVADFDGWASIDGVVSSQGGSAGLALAPGDGNPGGALTYSAKGGAVPDSLFIGLSPDLYDFADLGLVRLDLRYDGSGASVPASPFVIFAQGFNLEHDIPPPVAAAWSTVAFSLDDPAGWTTRDQGGSRSTTADDLDALRATRLWGIGVPGAWNDGPSTLWLDNVEFVLR